MEHEGSKLNELAERLTQRNGGSSQNYIVATQALRDDLVSFLNTKLTSVMQEMTSMKTEIITLKTELSECKIKLQKSEESEAQVLEKLVAMEKRNSKLVKSTDDPKEDYYIVGSSLLREVKETDISNGVTKSIPGGKISDVQKDIQGIKHHPTHIVTQIGGNDLEDENVTVDNVTTQYEVMVTDIKNKFPESDVIISGLPPRFCRDTIRTKVKDFNKSLKQWADQNEITFVDNESPFEYRTGEIDEDSYIMTGDMPALHLNRRGTVKLLDNLQKSTPGLLLSDKRYEHQPLPKKMSYAAAASHAPHGYRRVGGINGGWHYQGKKQRGCYNCGETNHGVKQCKYGHKIRCLKCHGLGHKRKFCVENDK